MKAPLALLLAAAMTAAPALSHARTARPTPDFTLESGQSIRTFRGQPIVLLVAPSPRNRAFRKQVRRLEEDYQRFAARGVLFVAAFTHDSQGLESNIPFLLVRNGADMAARFGIPIDKTPFALMVVGRDGNLDLVTAEVSGAHRVRDAILNNYEQQSEQRP